MGDAAVHIASHSDKDGGEPATKTILGKMIDKGSNRIHYVRNNRHFSHCVLCVFPFLSSFQVTSTDTEEFVQLL